MKMTSAKSHRELKDEGILIEFKETLGHAMCLGFVQFGDFLRIRNPKVKAPRISPPPCGIILFGSLVPSAL